MSMRFSARKLRLPCALHRNEPLRFHVPPVCACCGASAGVRHVHKVRLVEQTHLLVATFERAYAFDVGLAYCVPCSTHVRALGRDQRNAALIAVALGVGALVVLGLVVEHQTPSHRPGQGWIAACLGVLPALVVVRLLYAWLSRALPRLRLLPRCTMNPRLTLRPSGVDIEVGSPAFFDAMSAANPDAVEVIRAR